MDASSSSSVLPSTSDPPDPPDPSSISKTYHVKEISDTFIMSGDIQGPAPLIYFCNVLLLRHKLQFGSGETEIKEDALHDKLWAIATQGGLFTEKHIKQTLINFSSEYELIPLYTGATRFKGVDSLEKRGIKAFRVKFFHGLTFNPEDQNLKSHIGEKKYDTLINTLRKKEKRAAERNTEPVNGWGLFKQLVDLRNPYSISSILESIEDFGVFYRKGLFSTITKHNEELYVLHPGASHFANDVVWQKLIALTDMENGSASGFFNSRFESFDLPGFVELPMVVDKIDKIKRARAENEGFIRITERHKNFDPLKADSVQAIWNNVQRNSRMAKNSAGKLLGHQLPVVFSEYLKIYRVIVEASASDTMGEDLLKDLRSLKGAILELVETYLNNAELLGHYEESYIAPLMDTVLEDYFANAPDAMPSEFRYLTATVIKKCTNIPRTFKVAFNCSDETITNNLEYHNYCFSLLVKTLSHNFEDLNELPREPILAIITCAFGQTDITNLESVLELLEIFENNIRNGKLSGSDLNEYGQFVFSYIIKVYRAATDEKVHSLELIGGIFKFVEAFLDKAENLDTFEELYVVPLMEDILNECVFNAPNNTVEFQSLLRTIVNKCTKTDKMFMSILNSQVQEMTSKDPKYCHRLIILFYAACKHGCQFLTCLPDKGRNFLMDSISSALKHNELDITETGLLLLEKILSAFQAPKFECFYKSHFFTIERDVLEVLMISCHGSNMERLALELLQNLFTLVDKLSQPLWDAETTPVHYNTVFVMEHTTKFFVSACKEMASKEVRKFVDKVFDAKNDSTLFKHNTRELLSALKQQPESALDLNTVPSLNEKECSSSGLYAAQAFFIKTFKEQFKAFLQDFIESGDHSAHYKGVVYGMYGTGSTHMKISLEHIKIYRSGLARDLTRSFDSVQSAIVEVALEYAFGIMQELDSKLRMTPLHPLLRGASPRVSIVDMPQRMVTFSEFIASPGNQIVQRQIIFGGPNEITIQKQMDVGTRALSGYLDHLTSVHVQGDSWDGQFTKENFMVSDDEKFEICKPKCGSCSQQNKMNDYTQFEKEFLTLYGKASFIPVLAFPMKQPSERFPSTEAERLRVVYVTHPGGRPPVIRTALLMDFCRAWKFSRSHGKRSIKKVFDIFCDWRKKVKGDSFLKKIYDYERVDPALLAILRDLPETAIQNLSPGIVLVEGEHNHGDDVYDDTLLLLIIFIRHAIIHVADPEKWDYKTWIRRLTEIDSLLVHVLAPEIEQIISEFTRRCHLLSEEAVTMLEDSWNAYATYGMNHADGKQFTLRNLKSFSAAQAKSQEHANQLCLPNSDS